MTTDLIKTIITPKDVFVPGGLNPVLLAVDKEIKKFKKENNLDMEKKKDRDILRSFCADIPRSKVFVDDKRKLFVADKKAELKIIDNECKIFRDAMDQKKIETRKPLTEWEDAEKARIEAERQLEIFNMEHEDAIAENNIFDREKSIALKEAEIARQEEENRQKEEFERLEKERIEREERFKKEAAEKAKRDTEDKIRFEREEKERIEREAKEAKEKAERDRIAAEEKAKADQKAAVQKAKDDADAKVKAEKEADDKRKVDEKEIAQAKAANKHHQASVNNKILSALSDIGISNDLGKKLIIEIAQARIPLLYIRY